MMVSSSSTRASASAKRSALRKPGQNREPTCIGLTDTAEAKRRWNYPDVNAADGAEVLSVRAGLCVTPPLAFPHHLKFRTCARVRLTMRAAAVVMVSDMRHVWTMLAAVVIAPLAWLLLAFGEDGSLRAFANHDANGGFHTHDFLRPIVVLGAAGLLLGLIATLRLSPLGAVLTGLAYTASYALMFVAPDRVLDLLPNKFTIDGRLIDPATPLRTGAAMLLGAVLLVAVVSIGRWRRWPHEGDGAPEPASDADFPLMWDRPLAAEGLGPAPAGRTRTRRPDADAPAWTSDAGNSPYTWPTSGER
jgi:hypothetical protein